MLGIAEIYESIAKSDENLAEWENARAHGPHVFDVPLKDIIDLLLQVRTGHYSW